VTATQALQVDREAWLTGTIPPERNRAAWQSFTLEHWQAKRLEYGVTEVFTPQYWDRKLPVSGQNRLVTVYDIPRIAA
jgi:hypothetical protein